MAHVALGQAAMTLFALAGLTLILGSGEGLYLMAPAVLLSIGAAIYNAWVLLVEIVAKVQLPTRRGRRSCLPARPPSG
jgi:hypothetical protein